MPARMIPIVAGSMWALSGLLVLYQTFAVAVEDGSWWTLLASIAMYVCCQTLYDLALPLADNMSFRRS